MENYHVYPQSIDWSVQKWVVRKAGSVKSVCKTLSREKAIRVGTKRAQQDGVVLYIHDRTGRITERVGGESPT